MNEILGQDAAVGILRDALGSGRLHHAWIFSGPKGVGKFATAVALSRIVLDPNAAPNLAGVIEADPEGETTRLIDAGIHPDLHIIRKELAIVSDISGLHRKKLSNIPVDVLRERLIGGKTSDDKYRDGPAYRTATYGHGKCFIIDEAELIDRTGQNALLKTLEEPPPQTYITLITSRPERLLPTIRSRCQHVRFGRLDDAAMDAWFKRTKFPVDDTARKWIESFCEGSPGIAQLCHEYGFFRWQERLDPMIAMLERGMFPVMMGATLAELIETFAVEWVKRNQNASKDAANKDGTRHVLSLLAAHARGRLARLCDAGEDPTAAVALIDLLRESEQQLERNVNLKQLLENLVVQWAQPVRADVVV